MDKYKRIGLMTAFLLLIGGGFSHGLKFKKNQVTEEVIEYDDVVRKVKRVKRIKRVPANSGGPDSDPRYNGDNVAVAKQATHYHSNGTSYSVEQSGESTPTPYAGSGYIAMSGGHRPGGSSSRSSSPSKTSPAPVNSTGSTGAEGSYVAYPPNTVNSGSNTTSPIPTTPSTNNTSTPTTVSFSISSIAIKEGELILKGSNLTTVKSITVNGNSISASLVKTSSTASELVAMGLSGIQLAMGKIYNLVISDAYASSTFPIEIELADGSVALTKLAPLGAAQDGYVLKWDATGQSWVAAPDEVGVGSGGGGVTSITKGAGIVGEGAVIETIGNIAVNVGTNANQIPRFDADKKIILNNSNVIELAPNNHIAFKDANEEYHLRVDTDAFQIWSVNNRAAIFQVLGNDVKINGSAVCTASNNCPAPSGMGTVTSITAGSGLTGGTISTTGTVAVDVDNTSIEISSNKVALKNGGVTSAKLDSMGATVNGQVLKWNGSVWVAGTDNTGAGIETDPTVQGFAKNAITASCAADETLLYDSLLNAGAGGLFCSGIVLNSDDVTEGASNLYFTDARAKAVAVADAINDSTTDVAPSQNAVFDALAGKQPTIDGTSDITMKYIKLMTDGAFWVGLKAPMVTSANILFTLPGADGTTGQVLKTDGSGNLGWVDASAGSVVSVAANAPLTASGTETVTLSLQNNGITNAHINTTAAIAWSKIDKTGATAADLGGVPGTRTLTAGAALSGGGDLSADRTFNVNYDDSTIGINGSDQLIVKNGGITNDHINASAGILWSKINTTGADPADVGAASILTSILAGTGLTGGGTLSADRTLNVDVGTTAGKIVQLDGTGRLPAVDGSQLTNLGTNMGKWSNATGGIQYSSGNVGIGTNVPQVTLDVVSNSTNSIGMSNSSFASGSRSFLIDNAGTQFRISATSDSYGNRQAGLTVSRNRKIGIGAVSSTSIPYDVTLSGYLGNKTIGSERTANATQNSGNGNTITLLAGGGTVGEVDRNGGSIDLSTGISTGSGTASILFKTTPGGASGSTDNNPIERMIINGLGNVGIGTTNPSEKLEVNGGIRTNYVNYVWVRKNNTNNGETLTSGQNLRLDASGGSFTLTLPAAPFDGDTIKLVHAAGSISSNPITLNAGTGDTIVGDIDLVLDVDYISIDLIFDDENDDGNGDWRLY